ncbi:hypothetical protein PENNAL_c0061G04980 [Penicillium nalgiovense]|uniref:Uncharacterized protein n=1 Tax=Penicillium nalgiovense TaxID=60175 RepID=A0A1V6XQR6_PENNA|nr:hypothetical protein PENNAL_c0061G04980 [Penicillium nalgiovense]
MITEDEAEETDCETEKSSDEEELAKERNENQQTTDEEEVRTPQGRVSQRMTPMPEEQMSRTMMPMSDLMSDSESIDESMHSGETEGKPSQKRKANEMEDSEDETSRTPAPKRRDWDYCCWKRGAETNGQQEKESACEGEKGSGEV